MNKHSELYSMLCDLNGKDILERGDICIYKSDLLCCTVETDIIIKQLYSNKN